MDRHGIALLLILGLSTLAIGEQTARSQDNMQPLTATQDARTDLRVEGLEVGRAFPLSPSVRRECEPQPVRNYTCETLMSELAKLSAEPRDRAWASETEKRLRAGVLRGSTEVTIRALECRQSLCAIETASRTFEAGYQATSRALLAENGLVRVQELIASETDENGTRVVVLAQVFLRRPGGRVAGDQ
jgi:hypothetical protein